MKKILMVVFLTVFSMGITHGQTQQDSISKYNKINKWAVVKLTIAYMTDYNKSNATEKETYTQLKKKYEIYTDKIDLGSFEEALNNGWKTTKIQVYEKYKKELVDSITTFNFNTISFKPQGNEESRLIALSQINEKFDSLIKTNHHVKYSNPKTAAPQVEKIQVQGKTSLFEIIIYVILMISIILNVFLFLWNRSLKSGQKTDKVGDFDDFYKLENTRLKSENEVLKIENSSLNLEIEKLKQTPISSMNNNENSSKEEIPVADVLSAPIVLEVKNEQNIKKTIYLTSPFAERKFAIEDVSETEKPTSLYVAEIDTKTNKGVIRLIETADLSRALNSPSLYLETVCDYENPYNVVAKGIKVMDSGEISLEGEDWVVKKKIKIKFI